MPVRLRTWIRLSLLYLGVGFAELRAADAPFSLKNYVRPTPNRMDEPFAKQFSLEKAARFLDGAALDWQKRRWCFTCHTNYPYLYARPMISADDPAPREIRQALEDFVSKCLKDEKKWSYHSVTAPAALAINDSLVSKKLHPLTKAALDHMWTVQREDGGFFWVGAPPPLEVGGYYGVMLALIGVGAAPDGYAQTEAAQEGVGRIRSWLAKNPPPNLHQKAMLLWAATYHEGLMTREEKAKTIAELRAKQLADGGWAVAGLGKDWKRRDGKELDLATGDGYGTGFSVFVLRQAGVSAQDPAVVRGVAWLKSHQRASGRWFTRSIDNDDGRHYLTHIGSAFAVMAIQSCAASPSPPSTTGAR